MPQVQEKSKFPGYGIVYPEGISKGLKVVKAWTDGGKKIRHSDGTVEFLQPMPSIFELVGGAFCYASGDTIKKREHLEPLPDGMRERALAWFDKKNPAIPRDAIVDVPEPTKKGEPEPNWILSNERTDIIEQVDLGSRFGKDKPQDHENEVMLDKTSLGSVLDAINNLATIVKSQGDEIAKLKINPAVQVQNIRMGHKKQSEAMKAKWADPAYKAKMSNRGKKNDRSETSEAV